MNLSYLDAQTNCTKMNWAGPMRSWSI